MMNANAEANILLSRQRVLFSEQASSVMDKVCMKKRFFAAANGKLFLVS